MAIKNGSVIDAETAELIKAEYLASKQSIRQLSEKYEVPFLALKQRACYGKWNEERGQGILKTQLLKGAHKFTLSKDSLKAKSDMFVERMQQNCEDTLDILETIQIPKEWDRLALREQVLSALMKRGYQAYGLDRINGNVAHLMVHVQSDLSSASSVKQLPEQSDAIDVESVSAGSQPVTPPVIP